VCEDAKENNSTSETIKMDDCETDDMQKKCGCSATVTNLWMNAA